MKKNIATIVVAITLTACNSHHVQTVGNTGCRWISSDYRDLDNWTDSHTDISLEDYVFRHFENAIAVDGAFIDVVESGYRVSDDALETRRTLHMDFKASKHAMLDILEGKSKDFDGLEHKLDALKTSTSLLEYYTRSSDASFTLAEAIAYGKLVVEAVDWLVETQEKMSNKCKKVQTASLRNIKDKLQSYQLSSH